MPDNSPLRRPSDRVDELRDQLLRELKQLESGEGEEPELFRAYLRHAQALAWQGVAEGRMEAPRELLSALSAAEPFVLSHLEEYPNPLAQAAQEVHFTLRALRLATEALGERRIEDRLADDRSQTEREVLRVLARNLDRYLRRGAIHKRLELPDPPTPARVGQILVELDAEGLLQRIHGRAQGNPNAAFYALSAKGLDLCRSLELLEESAEEESPFQGSPARTAADRPEALAEESAPVGMRISTAVNLALDPNSNQDERQLVVNMLANQSVGPLGPQIRETLESEVQERGEGEAQQFYGEALKQIQITRVIAVTGGKSWTVLQSGEESSGTIKLDPTSPPEATAIRAILQEDLVGATSTAD